LYEETCDHGREEDAGLAGVVGDVAGELQEGGDVDFGKGEGFGAGQAEAGVEL
jgi:hypothetical protein